MARPQLIRFWMTPKVKTPVYLAPVTSCLATPLLFYNRFFLKKERVLICHFPFPFLVPCSTPWFPIPHFLDSFSGWMITEIALRNFPKLWQQTVNGPCPKYDQSSMVVSLHLSSDWSTSRSPNNFVHVSNEQENPAVSWCHIKWSHLGMKPLQIWYQKHLTLSWGGVNLPYPQ